MEDSFATAFALITIGILSTIMGVIFVNKPITEKWIRWQYSWSAITLDEKKIKRTLGLYQKMYIVLIIVGVLMLLGGLWALSG